MCIYLQIKFHDVFGEADSTHSYNYVWIYSNEWYSFMRNFCYTICTSLCSLCIAMMWGCNFAVFTFEHVWCISPLTRMFSIRIGCFQKCIGIFSNCLCAPIVATFGLFLSNIYIRKL